MSDVEFDDFEYDDDYDNELYGQDSDTEPTHEEPADQTTSTPKSPSQSFAGNAILHPGYLGYKIVNLEGLKKEQTQAIEYVEGVLGLERAETTVLLRYFSWKKDKLIETYLSDPVQTCLSAGVSVNKQNGGTTSPNNCQPRLKRVRGFVCDVCFEEAEGTETIALRCAHRYCKLCYEQYVTSKIMDDSESRRIECMNSECHIIVDERTIELLVPPKVLDRYRNLLNRTYVDDSPNLRWCPAPNCPQALECKATSSALITQIPTVTCSCGQQFCFACGLEGDHRPCTCSVVKKWNRKCEDDSETGNWIAANTKECTKCNATIEKNGGCNHMTCKKCKWEFCWVCMGPWAEHGNSWYNCSRYEEKGDVGKDAQSKSRANLERYLFYYNRFANHEQSIKLEKEIMDRAEKKMELLQAQTGMSWIECQFLVKAVEVLGRCRDVLKWTYAMAFYLQRNNQTHIFEDNQRDLEQAVESLAELVERPLEEANVAELRKQTTDKMVYVDKRRLILLQDTMKGHEEERWIWTETGTV